MYSTGIINHRDRGHAARTVPALELGEYLAVEDGTQVVLVPIPAGALHIGRTRRRA
jgi:hypothetical protein